MSSFTTYILAQLCSPMGRLQCSETPWMRYVLETYTDKNSYGEHLDAIEANSRAPGPTTRRQKRLAIPNTRKTSVDYVVDDLYNRFPSDMENLREAERSEL